MIETLKINTSFNKWIKGKQKRASENCIYVHTGTSTWLSCQALEALDLSDCLCPGYCSISQHKKKYINTPKINRTALDWYK